MTESKRDAAWDRGCALLLVAFSLPLYVYGMTSHGVVTPDEAYYHGVAEHMVASGDWLHVVFRGAHRPFDAFMNAPLHYWSRALLITGFGSSYWTMRVTAAVFAVGSVLLTYRLVRMLADRPTALLAGLVQLTTFQLVYMHAGRTGVLEPIVTFLVTLCALSFVQFVKTGRGLGLHHACLVLLVYVKAPTVLLPILAEVACFACIPRTRPHFVRWLRLGIAVAPIGLAWHAYVVVSHWDTLPQVFGLIGRHAGGVVRESFVLRRITNFGYYAGTTFFGAYPWSLLLPFAMGTVLWRGRSDEPGDRDEWRIAGLFVAAIYLFFLMIDKRYPWYVLPALPFVSAFVARFLVDLARRPLDRATLGWLAGTAGLLAALDVGLRMHNPFDPAFDLLASTGRIAPLVDLRSWPLLAGVTLVVAAGLEVLRRGRPGEPARVVAIAVGVVLLGFASVRVAAPLDRVDFVSAPEALRREIDAARSAGEPLPDALRIRRGRSDSWVARFYFADEFVLRPDGAGYRLEGRALPSGGAAGDSPGEDDGG